MAQVKRVGEQKYLIRVSKGTGAARSFINKTFHGTLADARAFAREIERAVKRDDLGKFKERLLESLDDPMVAEAIGKAVSNAGRRDLRLVAGARI